MADKKVSFEGKIKRLEEIVGKIESSEIELEDSIKLFEEGIKLSKDCQSALDDAESKVKVLVSDGSLKNFND
ncbi:MAG: exodeoxyribonuclease VII small subunit [Bdellovibrionales bacterium]